MRGLERQSYLDNAGLRWLRGSRYALVTGHRGRHPCGGCRILIPAAWLSNSFEQIDGP
jgi:hypothetical protein